MHPLCTADEHPLRLEVQQLTAGDKHHLFGYIGQSRTIPWNASGRYILGLEIKRIDRMPQPDEAAMVFVVDTEQNNRIIPLDRTLAWNPQQGTMFFWKPQSAETQFFFNDLDPATGHVFTVLYDLRQRKRVREYRYTDTPIGNGGVAADGSGWLGLNYGRMARLRRVTGYPGALDWSEDETAPSTDGVFLVDPITSEKRLLISFAALDSALKKRSPNLKHTGLFINHTLWNRTSDRIYFFVRAGWSGNGGDRVNQPCSIRSDGTELNLHDVHIGGHPEWADDTQLIGRQGPHQVLYDVIERRITGTLGTPEIFPNPEGDIALSPDGRWLVNGHKQETENVYTVFNLSNGRWARSTDLRRGQFKGDIRIDAAPRWNRTSDMLLVPGLADNGTRQMFLIRLKNN